MFSPFRCRRKYSGLDGFRLFFLVSRSPARRTFAATFVSAPSARTARGGSYGRKVVCSINRIIITLASSTTVLLAFILYICKRACHSLKKRRWNSFWIVMVAYKTMLTFYCYTITNLRENRKIIRLFLARLRRTMYYENKITKNGGMIYGYLL